MDNVIKKLKYALMGIIAIGYNHKNFSSIQKISSFNCVDFFIITRDTLVIFDVDETLISSRDTIKNGLIEPEIIAKIQILKNNNIACIACTALCSEKEGIELCMEQRHAHLKGLGFEASYADLVFPINIQSKRHPFFYKGILGTDSEQKGVVIGVFLDIMQIFPKNIIMFDDSLRFLQTVDQECQKREITFIGYLYRGARKYKRVSR